MAQSTKAPNSRGRGRIMKDYLLLILLLVPSGVLAQPPDDAGADAPSIIVTGQGLGLPPGTPAYGSVAIDRQRLLDNASGRLENVLANVAGSQQFRRSDSRASNPSNQGATLRALGGNASSRTLVLLDGVPVADPFFGYIPFSALVPDRLSVVRVTRGGGSGGGYVSLSGRWDRGNGFQTTPKSQRVAATVPAAYDSWSTNLRAVAPLSVTSELQFRATIFQDDRTLRFKGADSANEGQDASVRFISRGDWQVDALAYIQARNFSNIVISASTFRKSLDQRNTPSMGLGGKIEIRPPVGSDHVLRLGADTRFALGDMYEDAYDANIASNPVTFRRHAGGQQVTTGLFAEDDWTLEGLVLTGGVRADHWTISDGFYHQANASTGAVTATDSANRSDWQFSGRAGAILRLSGALALRGAGYTGFRLPTLNELYRPFVVFPITTQANAALKPERLKGVEAGFDLTPLPGVTLGATAFYNRLDDAIANVTIGTNTRQRQNVNRIVAKGIELTASARLGD
ncbi:hypothetical protein E4T56_gene9612, partial [Termitomyces sp. T112]